MGAYISKNRDEEMSHCCGICRKYFSTKPVKCVVKIDNNKFPPQDIPEDNYCSDCLTINKQIAKEMGKEFSEFYGIYVKIPKSSNDKLDKVINEKTKKCKNCRTEVNVNWHKCTIRVNGIKYSENVPSEVYCSTCKPCNKNDKHYGKIYYKLPKSGKKVIEY